MERGGRSSLEKAYRGLLRCADWACYAILLAMASVVTFDIAFRAITGGSTEIAEEAASLGLIALIFLSLPGTFEDQGFLRIDVLYNVLPTSIQQALSVLFAAIGLVVSGTYAVYLYRLAASSYQRGIRSDAALATPNYLPQCLMVVGVVLLGLVMAVALARAIRGWARERHND